MNREPGLFAVVGLLARTAAKRWFNRVRGNLGATWGRKNRKKNAARTATGRKSSRSMLGMAVFGGLMLFQAFFISSNFVGGLVFDLEERHYEPGPAAETPTDIIGLGGGVEPRRPRRHFSLLPSTDNWVAPGLESDLLRLVAPVLTLLMAALVFYSLGSGNTELSQVGWSMEWLFTFPVPTRGLLLARTGEYALSSAMTWFMVFPVLSTIFWNSGWGAAGLLLGLLATLCLAFMIGALRMVVETALRKRFSLHRLKNFQALCTVLGMLFLFGTFGLAFTGKVPSWLSDLADVAGEPLLWSPGAVALQVVRGVPGILGLLAWTGVIVFACLRAARTLVRDGLISAGGPYQGSREATSRKRGPRITGVLGKDLRLLARDRNFMVQTLVVPLIIIGFQAIVNPALLRSGGSPNTVAVTAFGVGAYVLIFGGFSILAVEGNSLWLLFSLPARLDEILRRKAVIWIVPGLAYAGAILAFAWRPGANASVGVYAAPLLALAGIVIFAFLAGGMGAMGTDPFEKEMRRKVRPEWSMLYMLVAGIYGYCIVKAPPWRQAGLVVSVTMLTWAIWDRVKERLPYLLDPTRAPPPRIAMSDGLVAGLVFLFLTVVSVALLAQGLPPGAALAAGYAIAGAATVLLTIYSLWRLGLRGILAKVGLSRAGLAPALALGCGLGAVMALLAWGYVSLLPRFGVDLPPTTKDVTGSGWLLLMVVVLAPLFEEFIFRGLLFNGMRTATRLPVAVVGSALVFGLVHPPHSFPPVFLLGAVAALLFHRTGLLWSSIAAHVTYNAIIIWVQS